MIRDFTLIEIWPPSKCIQTAGHVRIVVADPSHLRRDAVSGHFENPIALCRMMTADELTLWFSSANSFKVFEELNILRS